MIKKILYIYIYIYIYFRHDKMYSLRISIKETI